MKDNYYQHLSVLDGILYSRTFNYQRCLCAGHIDSNDTISTTDQQLILVGDEFTPSLATTSEEGPCIHVIRIAGSQPSQLTVIIVRGFFDIRSTKGAVKVSSGTTIYLCFLSLLKVLGPDHYMNVITDICLGVGRGIYESGNGNCFVLPTLFPCFGGPDDFWASYTGFYARLKAIAAFGGQRWSEAKKKLLLAHRSAHAALLNVNAVGNPMDVGPVTILPSKVTGVDSLKIIARFDPDVPDFNNGAGSPTPRLYADWLQDFIKGVASNISTRYTVTYESLLEVATLVTNPICDTAGASKSCVLLGDSNCKRIYGEMRKLKYGFKVSYVPTNHWFKKGFAAPSGRYLAENPILASFKEHPADVLIVMVGGNNVMTAKAKSESELTFKKGHLYG